LRDIAGFGGTSEMQLVSDRHKISQLLETGHDRPLIDNFYQCYAYFRFGQ
jgi:deoxyadenosine/deoxycytidine kinase